ncbi:PAF acetylhydrolase [Pseudovirgaria hyperparasitica]|uniref:Putative phospholipase n=1 Tax=Pseudovirgaria hyperparasitica TaxID=470096 RepID=A0A6A6W386_9PEZI|nr:PAF acetylhydrolase [Pseudovirgaria hyperparasitica]KAF2757322.1 PAF acetylhydrolase [Pseudovirgaria hyperparasitica]
MTSPGYRDDDVEMETLTQGFDEPDFPLPPSGLPGTRHKPRWLDHSNTRWQSILRRVPLILRPRLSWKYILFVLFLTYVFYCFAKGSPLLASRLPAYTGPYDVGTVDIEVPVQERRNISETVYKDTGLPAFDFETVLFSLYYPAERGAKSKLPKHLWVPKPVSFIGEGYARVAHINNFITRPLFTFGLWALAGSIKIPALVDVPAVPINDSEEEFPVIVFSHGTASKRTDYTQYCGELASRGVVVAAIEHRDGSGPGSIVKSDDGEKRVYSFTQKDLLADPPMEDLQLKKEQLDFRQAEIEETITVLRTISERNAPRITRLNERREGHNLKSLEGRLNLNQIVISGHSYGATGAMQAVKGAPSKKQPAIGAIMFDPGKSSGRLNSKIDIPILVVHSNSWSKKISVFFGRPHFDAVKEIVQSVLDRKGASWFTTMLGTSHPSITDAPIIEPLLLRWTTGATISVVDGLREYVAVTMEFLEFVRHGKKTGILAEKVSHPQYNEDERSEARKKAQDKNIAKFWQIHVAPE